MRICGTPQSLPECYGLVILLLSLSGLFPFDYEPAQSKFKISRKLFALTVLHVAMYTYVNISSLLENWKDFAQPMIGHSSMTAFGNLILRLGAIIITFGILIPLLFGSRYFVSSLNIYMQLIEGYTKLGIHVEYIYGRVYALNIVAGITTTCSLIFTAWHSIHFYKIITKHPPAWKYYLMSFLANLYKTQFLFYAYIELFTIYLLAKQLNGFIDTLLQLYQADYEKQMIKKDFLRKNNKIKW